MYVLRLYSAYSSLFLLLSLCHNVSCAAAAASYAKGAPTLHGFVATNTKDTTQTRQHILESEEYSTSQRQHIRKITTKF